MRRLFSVGLAVLSTAAVIPGVAGTSAKTAERDRDVVARLTKTMKAVCVGRFLIEMPGEAQVEFRQPSIDGFDISVFEESVDQFQKRVAARVAQIGARQDWLGGDKNMESASEIKTENGLIGQMFIHSRTVEEGTQGNGLGGVERYRDEGISTEALLHGNGISIDLSSENRGLAWIDDLPRRVNQIVVNPQNRIPVHPGFCMNRVHVRNPLRADQREQIMPVARLPSHPDVEFTLMLAAGLKPEKHGVLARADSADKGLSIAEWMHISTLRSAPREIHGLAGEELVERVVEKNDSAGHSFWWEVNGTKDQVTVPHLVFRMTTGQDNRQPIPSSLSDGAALALWDKITASIRLYPPNRHQSTRRPAPHPGRSG